MVNEALDAMHTNVDLAIKTFCIMGYEPFTHTVLDDTDILSSASPEVQLERRNILQLHVKRQGLSVNSKITHVSPNQINLTCMGSG
jgi:hypothetical protein